MPKVFVLACLSLAIAVLSGCSKYANTEWLEPNRGWRVTFFDTTVVIEDLVLDRTNRLSVSYGSDGLIHVFDPDGKVFSGVSGLALEAKDDELNSSVGDDFVIHLQRATEENKAHFPPLVEYKRGAIEFRRQTPMPENDEGYVALPKDALALLIAANRNSPSPAKRKPAYFSPALPVFASHAHKNMTDKELAESFVNGYLGEGDSFVRADMLARVPEIREKMRILGGRGDARLDFTTRAEGSGSLFNDDPPTRLDPIDMGTMSFAFHDPRTPCASWMELQLPYQVFREPYGWTTWTQEPFGTCRIVIEDESVARQVEAARVKQDLAASVEVYFRISGDRFTHDKFGVAPVFEPHKVRVHLYDTGNMAKRRISPPEGFTLVPEMGVSPTQAHATQ